MNTRLTTSELQHVLATGPTVAERTALAGYDVASEALLASRALQRRVDSKFLFSRECVPALLEMLSKHFRVVLSEGERAASYESLYYDTPQRDFFHEHRRGVKPRHKVRIRHYVERNVCFLETKEKTKYGVTNKSRQLRDPRSFALSSEDRAWIASVVGPTAPLVPRCWITFPRVTLVGVHHEERVTFDLGVAFDRGDQHVAFEGVVIAEVKQPRFDARSPAMQALRSFHIRPRRVSKYCAGVSLLEPHIQTHVFRPIVRDLCRLEHARSLS